MNSGVKGSMAGTSLAQGITRLLAPTDSAKDAMKKYGVEVAKNADGGINLKGTIENLRSSFSKMSKDTQIANAKLILGQTALKGWLPLITTSAEEYNKLSDAIYGSKGATREMMDEIERSTAYNFKMTKSAIEDLLIVIGDALSPALKDVSTKIGDFATKLSNWVTKMRETNPELLSLIGKIGLLAVTIPPVIMVFGTFTQGLGKTFNATSKTISAFVKFSKGTKMVAQGIKLADGKVGLLAKGISMLITSVGGATVAITAGVAILGALTIAVGGSGKALSWLQEKWGIFGAVVGGICENINGWFTLVFGNLGNLVKGVWKSTVAIFTGNKRDLGNIWRETWADIENTTVKAKSRIGVETTKTIREIRNASQEELALVEKGFETVYNSISNLTRDNYKDVAKDLATFVSETSGETLSIMRGTSDSMAMLFNNILASDTPEKILKKLEKNLKTMAKSGKYSAEEIQKDFEKAFELIQTNASTSSHRVGEEVKQITKYIGRVAQDGVDNVAINISGTLKDINEDTFNTLKSLGKNWQTLFEGVEYGSKDSATVIVENLRKMGEDTSKIIEALNDEFKNGFDATGKAINGLANDSTQATSGAFATMVENIKNNSSTGLDEVTKIFAEGLSALDANTLLSLKNTSSKWYSILNGAVNDNGELIENFAQQIMWNLGWVSQQTPEKLEGFKDGLLEALIEANLITADEMKSLVGEAEKGANEATKVTTEGFAKMVESIKENSEIGLEDMATIFANGLEKLDSESILKLKNTSDQWYSILNGAVNENGELVEGFAQTILYNLGWVSQQTPEKLEGFKDGLLNTLVEANLITADEMKALVETVEENVDDATKTTTEGFAKMVESIKDNSGIGMEEMVSIFATGLEKLDAESILKLKGTSDQWYSILNGAVDENGKLVEGFSNHILWNLGWVSQQTPEKLEGFKDGLLNALIEANLITADEMKSLVEEVDEKTEEAVASAEGTGEDIKKKVTPENTAKKVGEELDKVTKTINEKTENVKEESAKAGEEAQKQFDEKVSQLGKDIEVDSNIINVEALGVQFKNAGTLAIQNFVMGWSDNIGLITEAINLSLSIISNDFSAPLEVLNLAFDGVVKKAGLLNDTLGLTADKTNQINKVEFSNLEKGIDNVKTKVGETNVEVKEAKANVDSLGKTSIKSLTNGFSDTNSKIKELKNSVKGASDEVKNLSIKSLTGITNQTVTFKEKIDKAKDSAVRLLKEIEKIISKNFFGLIGQLDNLNSRLNAGISYADTFKRKLQDINNVTFGNVINGLANVNSWLASVKNNASNASYAIGNISTKRPRALLENDVATQGDEYFTAIPARTGFNMARYKTSGGYYSSASMAGTGAQARELESQKQQTELLKQQNELLKQLILATINVAGDVHVSVDLDGRAIAQGSAKYLTSEIDKLNKRKKRIGGLAY